MRNIDRFARGLELIRKETGSSIPLQQVLIFLHVGMNGTTNIGSICKVYNMTTASASRNTKKLEVTHGFIEQRPDPWDARTTLNSLSAKGAALYDRLVEILEG